MARARWAQWPLRGSPWALKYPYCHQMITQTHPRGNGKVFMKTRISKNLHVPLNSLSSVKMAKSSSARGHMGGADWGIWSWDPGPPPWVRGSIYKKNVLQDPGPNTRVPKCRGGGGGQNPKNHWGIIFGPKMMILQGVRRQKPHIGV